MRTLVFVCAGAMVLIGATDAAAQWWPQVLDGRATVSVNGGGQAGSTDIARHRVFELYEEEARFDASQKASTGAIFDIGGTYKIGQNWLGQNWGVGLGYTRSSGNGDAVLTGSIPNPGKFGEPPREAGVTAPGLPTRESAVHLQAVWFVPFIERVDFAFAAGPSFYSVHQGFATGFGFSEVPPAYDSVSIDGVDIVRMRRRATGFNISGDATYALTESLGAGLLLRYSRASVDFAFADGTTAELNPGGLQVGLGLRLRF